MIEDQVLYHLTKYENKIQSLLTFPERLMPHDEGAFLVLTRFESSAENQLYVL